MTSEYPSSVTLGKLKWNKKAREQAGYVTQPRAAILTISVIDQYCSQYQKIFPEVRSYGMLLGIITPSQRKSLTTIGEIVGLKNSQSLHNFITESPWSYQQFRSSRLKLTKELEELRMEKDRWDLLSQELETWKES